MKQVKIADLKNNLSRYLMHVRQGSEVTVLDRDTPIARIVPFSPRGAGVKGKGAARASGQESKDRVAELQRIGILGVGDPNGFAQWVRTHKPVRLPPGSPGAVDLLLQMRREDKR